MEPAWSCDFSVSLSANPHSLIVSNKPTSEDLGNAIRERLLRKNADELILHLAALEEHQRRHGQDSESRRRARGVVDVDFDDLETVPVLGGDLVDDRLELL